MSHARAHVGRRGFTLLEILIATTIFTIVSVAIFALLRDNVNHQGELSARNDLLVQGKNAMAIIKSELRESGRSTITPAPAPATSPVPFPFFFTNQQPPTTSPWNAYFAAFSYTPPTPSLNGVTDVNFSGASNALCYVRPQFDGTTMRTKTPRIDSSAGTLIWSYGAQYVFRIERGSDGVNELVNIVSGGTFPDGTTRRLLARNVQRLCFYDRNNGPTGTGIAALPLNELAIDLYLVKYDAKGKPVTLQLHDAVTMRNN